MADPYYASRELFQQEGQRKALGQSRGFSPSDLNAILRANFQNQQQNEIVQRELALKEKTAADEAAARARANRVAGISGITNVALNAPIAIKGYREIYNDWGKTGDATKTPYQGQQAISGGTVSPGLAIDTGATASQSVPALSGGTTSNIVGYDAATGVSYNTVTGEAITTDAAINASQAGATSGSAGSWSAGTGLADTTSGALGYGALAGSLGSYAGKNLIHGKYSKWAGLIGSVSAGAAAGGVYGAVGGLVVGIVDAFL